MVLKPQGSITTPIPDGAGLKYPPRPSDSIRGVVTVGWVIIALFFGGLGTWALSAPLNGAVVASGVVKVENNRKSVQHLDGGIVKELRVHDGDQVNMGDVLIVLDDSKARAEFQVLNEQYLVLRLTDERLRTEFDRGTELALPPEYNDQSNNPEVQSLWRSQIHQFESRRASIEGQRKVLRQKIAQLESQIQGADAQIIAYRKQFESVKNEMESLEPLMKKGLIARPRYLQLERTAAGLEGQVADTIASVGKARQAIAEQNQQMIQLDNDYLSKVADDLRDTQAKLLEVIARRANAQAVLSRVVITAPYAGRVVGLNVFSVGGVIKPGETILDIVPERNSLIIDAQIAVQDISEVRPGMRADIHLTAYKKRITPVVRGEVFQVSADRLNDERTGEPYYVVQVAIDQKELDQLPNVKLYPGMPAMVMLPTVERTAFDYLIGPLAMSFTRAFRQQ